VRYLIEHLARVGRERFEKSSCGDTTGDFNRTGKLSSSPERIVSDAKHHMNLGFDVATLGA
jgi:hypothetical protein